MTNNNNKLLKIDYLTYEKIIFCFIILLTFERF